MRPLDLDCLLFICIFMRLSGAYDVTTVRKISVQRGQSVIIPCLYKQKYAFYEKYLTAGHFGLFSDYIASSEQQNHQKKIQVSDDRSRNIFTVHMEDVQESAVFWCAVRIPSGFDKHAKFILEVTAGPPRLSVTRQDVSGSENGRVTVTCYHRGQSELRWCSFSGCCVTGVYGILDGASVEIRNEREHMTVSMSGLQMENTGWYQCSSDQLQMPVHITVHHHNQTLVTAETDTRTRTAVFFLLPVILEILLLIIIYSALKLRTLCKERCLRSAAPAEEGQYVTMTRKRSRPTYGSTAGDGAYEVMAELKTNTEPQKEPDYVNTRKT